MKKYAAVISLLVTLGLIGLGWLIVQSRFLASESTSSPDTEKLTISSPDTERLTIVTTIYPFTDLAQKIAGDRATVTGIVPGGVEPHDYEPTPRDIIAIRSAQIFIYNGLPSLEAWLPKVLPFVSQVAQLDASTVVQLLPDNPHYWLDPKNNQKIADRIRDLLIEKDPKNAQMYADNAAALKASLEQIDQEYLTQLSPSACQLHDIVVSHDAYGYMAQRYGFTTHSIAGLSPDAEPDAQTIAQLINLVRAKNIPYVLFESLASPRISEAIANETGVQTLMLNPIEGLTEEDIANQQDMMSIMRSNLMSLKKALKCNS